MIQTAINALPAMNSSIAPGKDEACQMPPHPSDQISTPGCGS